MCKQNKSIYGLKQVSRAWGARFVTFIKTRAWSARFVTFIKTQGFTKSKNDTSMFICTKDGMRAYLILYVADIVITASSSHLCNSVIAALKKACPITDEDQISSFPGISAKFNEKILVLESELLC